MIRLRQEFTCIRRESRYSIRRNIIGNSDESGG